MPSSSAKRKAPSKSKRPRVEPQGLVHKEPMLEAPAWLAPKIEINGETLLPTPSGAIYWPDRETLILADLHFEKGSSFARKGVMLPPYDTRTTLKRIAALCRRYQPRQIISLGDAFHDLDAEARMDESDALRLEALIKDRRWIWILGNHDPAPPKRFGGVVEPALRMGRLILRHEPAERWEAGELAGHLHPCARVRVEGRLIRRRCFAANGARMVLPAFGAYAGGLNVLDAAFDKVLPEVTAWVLGGRGVYPFGQDALAPDERRAPRATNGAGRKQAAG